MNWIARNLRHLGVGVLAAAVLLTAGACSDFLDINENPNQASSSDIEPNPELLFAPSLVQLQADRTIENIGNQFIVQAWSPAGFFFDPANYIISPFTTGNTWFNAYSDVAKDMQLMIDATNQADPDAVGYNPGNVRAQATIMQGYAYFYLTQFFGPVPATQANQPDEFPNPEPDPQEDVLREVIRLMDEAIDDANPGAGGAVQEEDLLYKGDMEKWVKLANTIKLRAYFLLDSGGADVTSEINNLFDNASLIRSNSDNALFPFFDQDGRENNFFRLSVQFSVPDTATGVPVQGWAACSDIVVDNMKDLGNPRDPRLPTYCTTDDVDGNYTGLESTEAPGGSFPYYEPSMVSDNIHRPAYPDRLATASEVWLREAEWEARNGNFGAANTALENGIQASMDFFDGRPGEIDGTRKTEYINNLPDLGSISDPVEYVQLQQYIDYFDRRPVIWTNWRRTKVPELDAPTSARFDVVLRRYSYPPDALANNSNINSQIQGNVPMWFEGEN